MYSSDACRKGGKYTLTQRSLPIYDVGEIQFPLHETFQVPPPETGLFRRNVLVSITIKS